MEDISLTRVISIVFIFICLLLAIFLFIVKTKHKLSNRLFAAFLILLAIDKPNLGVFINHLAFLQIPVFYLYIRSVCYSDFKLKIKHLLHSIPLLIVTLSFLPRYYIADSNSKIVFLETVDNLEFTFAHILVHIQIAAYIFIAFRVLHKFKKLYLENYTNTEAQTYKWLFQLTLVITAFYSTILLKNIFKFTNYSVVYDWAQISVSLAALIIICWFVLMALNYPNLFRGVNSKLQLVNDLTIQTDNSSDENKNRIQVLKTYMVDKEPFLDPTLTIQGFSEKIELPSRELSILINKELGQHFFDFVNNYRIKKAKTILKDPTKSKHTVLEILYEVGFNSKSSFNTAFKKHTGTTPTVYRKS